jgi:hypothetical protein
MVPALMSIVPTLLGLPSTVAWLAALLNVAVLPFPEGTPESQLVPSDQLPFTLLNVVMTTHILVELPA